MKQTQLKDEGSLKRQSNKNQGTKPEAGIKPRSWQLASTEPAASPQTVTLYEETEINVLPCLHLRPSFKIKNLIHHYESKTNTK